METIKETEPQYQTSIKSTEFVDNLKRILLDLEKAQYLRKKIRVSNLILMQKALIDNIAYLFVNKRIDWNPLLWLSEFPESKYVYEVAIERLSVNDSMRQKIKFVQPFVKQINTTRPKFSNAIDEFFGETLYELYDESQCMYTGLFSADCKCNLHSK